MRQRARVDGNHAEIVATLRRAGCSVQSLAMIGAGAPDLLIGIAGANYLVEVKDGRRPPSKRLLTPAEVAWHGAWRGQVAVVATIAEALAVIGCDP
jgi:hypothetical protein